MERRGPAYILKNNMAEYTDFKILLDEPADNPGLLRKDVVHVINPLLRSPHPRDAADSGLLASPSDVAELPAWCTEVVRELNLTFGKRLGWQMELLGWEDTLPGYGKATKPDQRGW